MKIRGQEVGKGRCYVVAEVAQGHEGSVAIAHAYIEAVARAGADAVKFQCHIAAEESERDEEWRVKPHWSTESRYEYWQRMEFTPGEWCKLRQHAHERGLGFIVSPFSLVGWKLLTTWGGIDAWKVASGEVRHEPLIRAMVETGLPIIISTGMSTSEELNGVYGWIPLSYPQLVLQCTSVYPCPPEKIGLAQVKHLGGLSDHSGSIFTGLAAVTMGCDLLEVHVVMSRELPGPDATSSITTGELKQLVEGIRWIERMKANPVDKQEMARTPEIKEMRRLFMRTRQADGSYRKGGIKGVADEADTPAHR